MQVQDGGAGWSCRVEVRVGVRVEADYREDYAHADRRACLQPFSYVCSLGGSTQPGSLLRRPAPPRPPRCNSHRRVPPGSPGPSTCTLTQVNGYHFSSTLNCINPTRNGIDAFLLFLASGLHSLKFESLKVCQKHTNLDSWSCSTRLRVESAAARDPMWSSNVEHADPKHTFILSTLRA